MFEVEENGIHHCRQCDGACPKGRRLESIDKANRLARTGQIRAYNEEQDTAEEIKSSAIKKGKYMFTPIKNHLNV